MTVHRNRFLLNKTNRRTEFQFLLVLLLYMFRAAFLPIIRSSQTYIGFGTFYAVVMNLCCEEQDGTLLSIFHSTLHTRHPYRITSTKCRINTIVSPDDGYIVARNIQRLISPWPDLLPDVFFFMVRIFLLMLVLFINSTNIPPIMITNRIYETQNLLPLQLVSFLIRLRTYQHSCSYEIYAVTENITTGGNDVMRLAIVQKSAKQLLHPSFHPSICSHVSVQFPMGGFP